MSQGALGTIDDGLQTHSQTLSFDTEQHLLHLAYFDSNCKFHCFAFAMHTY